MDDNIIFCHTNINDWTALQEGWDTYEVVVEQGIDKHKIDIFFSSNTN